MFETIGIILKQQDPRIAPNLQKLAAYLHTDGRQAFVEEDSGEAYPDCNLPRLEADELARQCDLVIAMGGDGTMLQAARLLAEFDVPLVGINLGRLGFLTDITPVRLEQTLDAILAGEYKEERRFMLHAAAYRGERFLCDAIAFNDVVVHKWNMTHLFTYSTHINGQLVSIQRADGLIVSTPTGSTAYALSGGGPLLHPSLNVILLVSICPHSLSNRPIGIDADSHLEIILPPDQPTTKVQMSCDGDPCQTLFAGDRVIIKKHHHVRMLHPMDYDLYAMWRAKLSWGKDVDLTG
jgi:NAD+ kinase